MGVRGKGFLAAPVFGSGGFAALEPPALVAGLDDVAVMGQAVEQCGGHLGVAEQAHRFDQIMPAHLLEALVLLPLAADEDRIDRGLHVMGWTPPVFQPPPAAIAEAGAARQSG